LRADTGVAPAVVGDRVQLQQVVVNLLINSIQAIATADVVERRIELRIDLESADVMLSVRDTGPGIAEENLAQVFDGFFTTKPSGMGIGLAICQSIAAEHGGQILAANHPDGGAVLRVALPAAGSSKAQV
jgi:C4-dicarboxylate-specific signal transduction histidine kinase